ncbi:hypothetical protein FIE12Z_965 [Fusarium flagelliforme]|uniref:Hydrophobin n=1 Tax=Fusarium flagelliforme TaxID=2675880 RepID=A0A395N3P9_9HYPO|nr:hypothetical protein FIE12Z_965 [Fusarium flagelliforme]
MQIHKLALLALLSATGEACRCYGSKGNPNNGATHKCCNDFKGVFSGVDCKLARSLSTSVGLTVAAKVRGLTATGLTELRPCLKTRWSRCLSMSRSRPPSAPKKLT